jgi:potassium efflux system protein
VDGSELSGASLTTASSETEVAALKAETARQIKALETSTPGESAANHKGSQPSAARPEPTADQPLRQLLQDRLRWLDEYDQATKALKKAISPEPNPEQELAEAQEERKRVERALAQAAKDRESLLPEAYRHQTAGLGVDLKDVLEAATNTLKDRKSKLETLRSNAAHWESQQAARQTERDKLFQQVATMKARTVERDAIAGAITAQARRLAQERLVNFQWQVRVAALRLEVKEAELVLETKRARVREASLPVCRAQVQIAEQALELLQARYRAAIDLQERELKSKAASEENKAQQFGDPLQRYRASRLADLLLVEARVVKNEQALATCPPPSLDEQRALADHAEADFAGIKELLDDGRISRLDAIRLTNEFRRIGPARDRLLRNEMATVEARLQFYENILTEVELELLQDSLHDRFELDLLHQRLPQSRWAEGEALLAELEQRHRELLVRRRKALARLTDVTAQTLDQVVRRLHALDEEYGFIRTHIFWVRDQEPIGLNTLGQGSRDVEHVVKGMVQLAQETSKDRPWSSPSAEFLATVMAVLGLPVGLMRLRRVLLCRIDRDVNPPRMYAVEPPEARAD